MFQVFKARERLYEGDSCSRQHNTERNLCLFFIFIFKNDPIIPCSIFILTLCQNVMILLWCNVNDD